MKKPNRRHRMSFDIGGDELATLFVDVHKLPRKVNKIINIGLTEPHVDRSLAMQGQGDGNRCAGSVCVIDHKDSFSHPVHYVEWTDSRLYVVHKKDKKNFPTACIPYTHTAGHLAQLFDDRTGHGVKKIRKAIQKAGGILPIRLEAIGPRIRSSGPSGKQTSGARAAALLRERRRKAMAVEIDVSAANESHLSTRGTGTSKGKKSIPRGTMRRIFRSRGAML